MKSLYNYVILIITFDLYFVYQNYFSMDWQLNLAPKAYHVPTFYISHETNTECNKLNHYDNWKQKIKHSTDTIVFLYGICV